MAEVLNFKQRYSPKRVPNEKQFAQPFGDVMASLQSFQATQLLFFLDQAKEALDALHTLAHEE